MEKKINLGLGRIHAEPGEIRAYLPDFVNKISHAFGQVDLEEGYGEAMGITLQTCAKPSSETQVH